MESVEYFGLKGAVLSSSQLQPVSYGFFINFFSFLYTRSINVITTTDSGDVAGTATAGERGVWHAESFCSLLLVFFFF